MEQSHKELIAQPQVMMADEQEREIDLLELFYHLLDHWKMILVFFLVGALAMGGYTKFFMDKQYEATAKMYVLSSSDSVVNLSDLQLGSQLTSDYLEVFETHEVTNEVIRKLDLPYDYDQLQRMLSLSNTSGTRIINIKITSTDPNEAANIANEFLEVASQYVADVMITDKPTVLSVALVPDKPVGPSTVKNAVLGAMLGIMASCGYLVVRFLLDDKVKSAEDITKLTGMPVLAEVPTFNVLRSGKEEQMRIEGRNEAV